MNLTNNNMPTTEFIPLKPGFSWHRLSLVSRYYYPLIRPQILIYPLTALVLAAVQSALNHSEAGILFGGMFETFLNFMMYFSPCIFAKRSDRYIETMLPATGVEKSVFILTYCLVLLPMLTWGLHFCALTALDSVWPPDETVMAFKSGMNEMSDLIGMSGLVRLAQEYIPLSTCLYCVMALKNNRMIMSMVWAVVSLVSITVLGAIAGIWMAMTEGFDKITEMAASGVEDEDITRFLVVRLKTFIYVLSYAGAAYTLLMAWLTARKISRIQL